MKTVLLEGRDAPLYHGTTMTGAESILLTDALIGGHTLQPVPGRPIKDRTVSFTRDFRFALDWTDDIVLEFDQNKLSHNYKIIPSNYWSQIMNRVANPKQNVARPQAHHFRGQLVRSEYEELVVGKVVNIHRYLTKIHMINKINEERLKISTYFPTLANHPLLWSDVNKKWINK